MKKKFMLVIVSLIISFISIVQLEAQTSYQNRYELAATQNVWTFLKLDTITGRIWQVQFSTQGDDYRFETPLNPTDLAKGKEQILGRFKLYPTQNTYNFILLDTIDGITYQVQWNSNPFDRVVIRIE